MKKQNNKKQNLSKTVKKTVISLTLIIILFLSLKIYVYSDNEIWWDSAVYINMGKYMFSNGNVGLWEDSRPLVLPFLLGLSWKFGLDPIIAGKTLMLLFSVGCIIFTYFIAKELFNENVAILSSIFLSIFPTFFKLTEQILTEIPSLFFSILGIYLFLKKKYFWSGLILCISFMTRFLFLGVFGIILIFLFIQLYTNTNKKTIFPNLNSPISKYLVGFLLLFMPYLVINYIIYKNPILPFTLQAYLSQYTGWMWWEPFYYYFSGLFLENYLLCFVMLGLGILIYKISKSNFKTQLKNSQRFGQFTILALLLIYFTYFSYINHKEMRFTITFLPYLLIISSFGIIEFLSFLKKIFSQRFSQYVIFSIFLIFIFILLIQTFYSNTLLNKTQQREISNMQLNFKNIPPGSKIAISNPIYPLYSNNNSASLIYYPTFNSQKAQELLLELKQGKIYQSDYVLFSSCDVPCPTWDKSCEEKKLIFIEVLKLQYKLTFFEKNNGCENYFFEK